MNPSTAEKAMIDKPTYKRSMPLTFDKDLRYFALHKQVRSGLNLSPRKRLTVEVRDSGEKA